MVKVQALVATTPRLLAQVAPQTVITRRRSEPMSAPLHRRRSRPGIQQPLPALQARVPSPSAINQVSRRAQARLPLATSRQRPVMVPSPSVIRTRPRARVQWPLVPTTRQRVKVRLHSEIRTPPLVRELPQSAMRRAPKLPDPSLLATRPSPTTPTTSRSVPSRRRRRRSARPAP